MIFILTNKYHVLIYVSGVNLTDISTNIGSLTLRNPTILASGIMDEDAGSMKRVFENGASSIVTKSIGLKPKKGYNNPTFVELENGILNAMGLPNPGIDDFKNEVETLKRYNVPVIGSIFGSNSNEFLDLGMKMQKFGADALELNLSCPHAKGYGVEIGSDIKLVEKIVTCLKDNIEIPIFVKISSNLTNILEIAEIIEKSNADAIVAINSVKAMKIDLDFKTPVLANKYGGYSGKAIKPIGVRCVYELFESVKIPIIGVGGINSGEDALEYIMAGASAVQIGSGLYYRGIDVFQKVCSEIINWMKTNSYKKLYDLIGVAHL
jgi:dihydroorotate dehydrogenase (NAD+) catalytic subunit